MRRSPLLTGDLARHDVEAVPDVDGRRRRPRRACVLGDLICRRRTQVVGIDALVDPARLDQLDLEVLDG
jgi:hypothetical protein